LASKIKNIFSKCTLGFRRFDFNTFAAISRTTQTPKNGNGNKNKNVNDELFSVARR
jgi:hypothetical protein